MHYVEKKFLLVCLYSRAILVKYRETFEMARPRSILQQAASNCAVAQDQQSQHVTIDNEALLKCVQDVSRDSVQSCCRAFRYPCKFDNQEDEITFMAVRWLLDFGSGYNKLLEGTVGKDAKDIVQVRILGTASPM